MTALPPHNRHDRNVRIAATGISLIVFFIAVAIAHTAGAAL